ncbi:uncharacterized protein BXZ73DRAFT_79510 [Epithele typhae]|uniref:uncharacterized protein n=1 Tax=Epithele typhae TaxID=378194 RepID=UPI0020084547|nr:uncharacterized protein BXZ73DRAFT_79510 [Epithele typhae]KAH9923448.1 hypothetical protein BXZ73DRAFT_79510 [Epithele typhae]
MAVATSYQETSSVTAILILRFALCRGVFNAKATTDFRCQARGLRASADRVRADGRKNDRGLAPVLTTGWSQSAPRGFQLRFPSSSPFVPDPGLPGVRTRRANPPRPQGLEASRVPTRAQRPRPKFKSTSETAAERANRSAAAVLGSISDGRPRPSIRAACMRREPSTRRRGERDLPRRTAYFNLAFDRRAPRGGRCACGRWTALRMHELEAGGANGRREGLRRVVRGRVACTHLPEPVAAAESAVRSVRRACQARRVLDLDRVLCTHSPLSRLDPAAIVAGGGGGDDDGGIELRPMAYGSDAHEAGKVRSAGALRHLERASTRRSSSTPTGDDLRMTVRAIDVGCGGERNGSGTWRLSFCHGRGSIALSVVRGQTSECTVRDGNEERERTHGVERGRRQACPLTRAESGLEVVGDDIWSWRSSSSWTLGPGKRTSQSQTVSNAAGFRLLRQTGRAPGRRTRARQDDLHMHTNHLEPLARRPDADPASSAGAGHAPSDDPRARTSPPRIARSLLAPLCVLGAQEPEEKHAPPSKAARAISAIRVAPNSATGAPSQPRRRWQRKGRNGAMGPPKARRDLSQKPLQRVVSTRRGRGVRPTPTRTRSRRNSEPELLLYVLTSSTSADTGRGFRRHRSVLLPAHARTYDPTRARSSPATGPSRAQDLRATSGARTGVARTMNSWPPQPTSLLTAAGSEFGIACGHTTSRMAVGRARVPVNSSYVRPVSSEPPRRGLHIRQPRALSGSEHSWLQRPVPCGRFALQCMPGTEAWAITGMGARPTRDPDVPREMSTGCGRSWLEVGSMVGMGWSWTLGWIWGKPGVRATSYEGGMCNYTSPRSAWLARLKGDLCACRDLTATRAREDDRVVSSADGDARCREPNRRRRPRPPNTPRAGAVKPRRREKRASGDEKRELDERRTSLKPRRAQRRRRQRHDGISAAVYSPAVTSSRICPRPSLGKARALPAAPLANQQGPDSARRRLLRVHGSGASASWAACTRPGVVLQVSNARLQRMSAHRRFHARRHPLCAICHGRGTRLQHVGRRAVAVPHSPCSSLPSRGVRASEIRAGREAPRTVQRVGRVRAPGRVPREPGMYRNSTTASPKPSVCAVDARRGVIFVRPRARREAQGATASLAPAGVPFSTGDDDGAKRHVRDAWAAGRRELGARRLKGVEGVRNEKGSLESEAWRGGRWKASRGR